MKKNHWRGHAAASGLAGLCLALPLAALAQTAQNSTYNYQYDANGNLTQISDPQSIYAEYRRIRIVRQQWLW